MYIIKINKKTKTKLERLKLYKDESFDTVIERLVISQDDLDSQTIRNIRKSLVDIKKGKVYSLAKVAKQLGL